MSVVTIQTLALNAQKMPENKQALEYLEEYGAIFGQAIRKGYSERNKIGKTDKKARDLESFICKQLEENYSLSATEARNAYNKSSAAYDSQSELVDLYIDESDHGIRELRRTIKKLEFKRKKAQDSGQTSTASNLTKKIHYKQQKINKLEAKIGKLKESRDEGKFSVTFGSAKLFEKQYSLEENGYASHEEWLEDWRESRSNSSFFIGSKNYHGGNQLVRYDAENHTLTITVTPSLREKYGNTVTLHHIAFLYGEEWLKAAIEPVRRTSTRVKRKTGKSREVVEDLSCTEPSELVAVQPKKIQKVETSRNGSTLPVTYEIVRLDGNVYINATIETIDPVITTSLENGSLGIDFNPGSIDWTLIDRHGNLKRHGSIKTNVQDKRSKQTKDIIGKAVSEVVKISLKYNVPVVIEDLDFAQKKASMKEKGARYARMLSNMAYSQFTQMIESKCLKSGIELIKIHPAYTSVIGVTKYMAVYSLNSGESAALVIARRGQGRTEKLPTALASYFRKPADMLKSGAWAKVAKKINICGGFNRHKFYSLGIKQARTNRPLNSKLRQTTAMRRLDTVQVKVTPYIGQKRRAIGSPVLKGLNP
ncbi:MAG: IS200/IS605 family accessory protein TnpB-related protein [Stigonema ocellatum SAG 48.90 = DSM 106950]|nr:IS200/IS605 family accessory protein TnpB-related protein [Stigonema ocellatum SAG 48.90 = DSM 106950]